MNLIPIFILQVLVFFRLVFSQEQADIKAIVCGGEHEEFVNMMIDCLDEMNLESMSDVMKSCYPGISNEINGAEIIKWSCEHTDEEMLAADKCSEQLMKETGDDEDMHMDMMNDMMTCVEEKWVKV